MQNQNTRHNSKNNAGFSLLELLIAMGISVIAITAAVGLMTKFARTVGAFTEVSTLTEAAGTAETLLRADLDAAGHNLTRSSPPLAGTIFPSLTTPDFYTWSNGTITKTSATGWEHPATISHALTTGVGSFRFTPPDRGGASAEISGPNNNSFGMVIDPASDGIGVEWISPDDSGGNMAITIYENGKPVASSTTKWRGKDVEPGIIRPPGPSYGSFRPHSPGDSYIVKIENDTEYRVAKLYRTSKDDETPELLWTTSKEALPSYPVQFAINLYTEKESFTNITLTGAPLVPIYSEATEFAPLPYDLNAPTTTPVEITNGGSGLFILSGDPHTDAVTTLTPLSAGKTEITIRGPQRGSFNRTDVVLIIDWGSVDPANRGNATSALCSIRKAQDSADGITLTLERIDKSTAAWGRLFSSEADHDHTFAAGSTLVKLQAPVAYNLSNDARLVRTEGDRSSTVAFNVRRATFNRYVEFNSSAMMYLADIRLGAEGVETRSDAQTETRNTIQFRATPRALNLASNHQN